MTSRQLGSGRKKYERRNGAVRQHYPGKGIGKYKCFICQKEYMRYGKFDRFCNSCRLRT